MACEIYYFTATGNSLDIARQLGNRLSAPLFPITSFTGKKTTAPSAGDIGLVFPVYLGGVPRIVENFVKKLKGLGPKYIFAAVTLENTSGAVFRILSRDIKKAGGNLACGFCVDMPGSYIVGGGAVSEEAQQKLFNAAPARVLEIGSMVSEHRHGVFESRSVSNRSAGDRMGDIMLNSMFINSVLRSMYKTRDRYFYTDGNCNGCGTCSRLCPAGNIEMKDKRPSWKHDCEQCFACLQWCPKQAIQYRIHPPFIVPGGPEKNMTGNRKRYHHPGVNSGELFLR